MNFFIGGSINDLTHQMKLQTKWQQKKDTKQYTAKSDEEMVKKDKWALYKEQIDRMRENEDPDMESIMAKVNAGKKLSPEELNYLASKDPMTYQEVKATQAEKEAYERELKECKTKEEVQRIKTVHLSSAMSRVQAIENNPNIPKIKKMQLMMQVNAKLIALREIEQKFVESGEYAKLESEQEQNMEEQEIQEEKINEILGSEEEKEAADSQEAVSPETAEKGAETPKVDVKVDIDISEHKPDIKISNNISGTARKAREYYMEEYDEQEIGRKFSKKA